MTGPGRQPLAGDGSGIAHLPPIKFLKRTVPDIMDGSKTLEARPRSEPWIRKIQESERARLTYGPMMGAPTVFAVARILAVQVRGFETATREDIDRIGAQWAGRDAGEFAAAYAEWYAKDLAKGYAVAWISFEVDPGWSP